MKTELKKITVKRAKELLGTNTKNRPLDTELVEEMKNDILNGSFDVENTFVVLKDDKLFYGQHTLNAIIEANKTLELNLVTLNENDKHHFAGMLNGKSKYKYRFINANHNAEFIKRLNERRKHFNKKN